MTETVEGTTAHVPTGEERIVRLPMWLMRSHGLASRELRGRIARTTARGILFQGVVNVRRGTTCLRCGRGLENGISQACGYGPDCSAELGIPRDLYDAEDVAEIRKRLELQTYVEMWLPLAKIQVLRPGEEGEQPVPVDVDDVREPEPETGATHARVEDEKIIVRTHFNLRDRAKSVPGGTWHGATKTWRYDAGPTVAAGLAKAYAGLEFTYDPAFGELLVKAEAAAGAEVHKTRTDLDPIPHLKTVAWMHQRQAFEFGKQLDAVMLAMGMGTGKSLVTVGRVGHEFVDKGGRRGLIACPRSVLNVWSREFRRHADYPVRIILLNGDGEDGRGSLHNRVERAKRLTAIADAQKIPVVYVINYESAWREPFATWAMKQAWDIVILDESHRIKSPGGKASRYFSRLRSRAKVRMCLTGTPLANSPMDIYAQYRFLDPGIFGTSFNRFKQRYAIMGGFGGYQIVDYVNQDELADKIYSIGFRVGDEVLDLPEYVDDERPCEIGRQAVALYEVITRELYAMREGDDGFEQYTATNVLTRLLRQQQLTGGAITDDDGVSHEVDTAKADALRDLLEDIPPEEPVVVFTRFTHDLDAVKRTAEQLKRTYGELSGRSKNAIDRDACLTEGVQIAGVQIQSGGVGIDLTRARYAVYYSLGFSLTDYEQSRKRIHRPGQTRTTTYYHLIASNVDVDRKVYAALRAKTDVVDFVMKEMGR